MRWKISILLEKLWNNCKHGNYNNQSWYNIKFFTKRPQKKSWEKSGKVKNLTSQNLHSNLQLHFRKNIASAPIQTKIYQNGVTKKFNITLAVSIDLMQVFNFNDELNNYG